MSGAQDTADLVVVGSGIVGLGAAYAAVRRGLRVIVVDRADAPVGATIRNFGHLCIGAQSGEARRYADTSRHLWLRLSVDAGFWLRESGTLVAARHDDEIAVLEAASRDGGIRMLDVDELLRAAPLRREGLRGGAHIETDLQTDPRSAASAIVRHLAVLGVDFRFRTAVSSLSTEAVHTTRGIIRSENIVVAAGHDLDQLLPEVAERHGIVRCALDMMRAAVTVPHPLMAPLLTGWSLVRYGRFAGTPEGAVLRERLHVERPDLAALDLNQMYTQLPDGTLIIGDSHATAVTPPPFQPEAAFSAFLAEAEALFDMPTPRVLERWQGVYAKGPQEFLIDRGDEGALVLAATTGIGMTTGLGLAEENLTAAFGWAPAMEGTS
ncbi:MULTISPECIES: TIGR03364 family FAD-dependent oxidoreductase [unclassified Microbacterium]|uniref:TIGR03364 family FAD-dependent oxidoreductase n=1 Tax=unclassified Microbacterium TaxID=2609290 RepID=UPI000EA9AB95|nr:MULTISPECIES: TIGR03364 family FAD-dependent oxidoreductase [unclassified Microbacterium]MBT2483434.1 TIGR03364 family FAD-dependent oxidoreductase [Microbacterium sp. ISL-108]RKN66462.1 TIGR03364 family FAD-dependent oxidoreductase [Microbacterium sp. CGR2]